MTTAMLLAVLFSVLAVRLYLGSEQSRVHARLPEAEKRLLDRRVPHDRNRV